MSPMPADPQHAPTRYALAGRSPGGAACYLLSLPRLTKVRGRKVMTRWTLTTDAGEATTFASAAQAGEWAADLGRSGPVGLEPIPLGGGPDLAGLGAAAVAHLCRVSRASLEEEAATAAAAFRKGWRR